MILLTIKALLYKYFVVDLNYIDAFCKVLRNFMPFYTFSKDKGATTITLVTRAKDVREIMRQHEVFRVIYKASMEPATGPFMLARDVEPLHDNEKAIMMTVLSKDDIPMIQEMASMFARQNIVDALKKLQGTDHEGEVNVVTELGRKVAIQIIENYFGFVGPSAERKDVALVQCYPRFLL